MDYIFWLIIIIIYDSLSWLTFSLPKPMQLSKMTEKKSSDKKMGDRKISSNI